MKRIKYLGFIQLCMLILVGCAAHENKVQLEEDYIVATAVQTKVDFELTLDGISYAQDAAQICISSLSAGDLEKLPQMTGLKQVTVTGGGSGENLEQLRTYCDENGVTFRLELVGQTVTDETEELTLSGVTEEQVALLALMPKLQSLHFPEPEASAESLLALREKLSGTAVTWEKTVLTIPFREDATVIDLMPVLALHEGEKLGDKTAWEYGLEFETMGDQERPHRTAKVLPGHPFPDRTDDTEQILQEVEAAMAYFPEAQVLELCGTWLDNESVSQFRERHREDYKVVWTVLCGDLAPRTDAKFFMPTKYYVTSGNFNDLYSYNLQYCEEIVAMDIGHMHISDIDFVRYMPDLQYLVLFSQSVYDLSPLSECKKLVYLELSMCDWITDYSPLQECTALEDLNVEGSAGDITQLFPMTWLKNLWLGDCGADMYQAAKLALPDTNVVYDGSSNKDWRTVPNYFKMRDALLMFYMD